MNILEEILDDKHKGNDDDKRLTLLANATSISGFENNSRGQEKQWHRSQQGWCRLGQLWLPAPGLFGEIIFTLYQIILYHMCPIQETWDLVRNRIIDAYSTQIQAGNFQLTNHFLFTETLRP